MRGIHWLSSILLASLLPACVVAAPPSSAEAHGPRTAPLPAIALPPDLDRVLRDYERAWRAGDAAALAELFTEDGFALSNGAPARRGRPAIRAGYGDAGGELQLAALAYSADGDVGYIVGRYWYGAEPDAAQEGKFLLALRRTAGGPWLIAADMDNSNWRER